MLLSFVLPETLMAVALLFLITSVAVPFELGHDGTGGRPGDLPAVLPGGARARPAGRPSASNTRRPHADLGASPLGALRRVILPMLMPAIFASTVLVFADVIDDFVIVRYLSGDSSTEPVSVKIYNTARAAPTPALNALATMLLLAARSSSSLGFLVYRVLTRGDATQPTAASVLRRRGLSASAGRLDRPPVSFDR